ncbi:MAG: ECF transporter S component [Clostridia bacterium]|nr:ECF transporter S component [Clostridia bacterium]
MSQGSDRSNASLLRLVFAAVLAAMVYLVTMFRFPLLGSKVHFANAVCLLSGLLLGPVWGGFAAGMGSALYDLMLYNEGIINLLITFVSKFAMAWVCGKLYNGAEEKKVDTPRLILACVAGALTYVVLYMLKSGIYGAIAGNFWAPVISKFPASIINAGAAIVAAPIFYHAMRPALKSAGILAKLRAAR